MLHQPLRGLDSFATRLRRFTKLPQMQALALEGACMNVLLQKWGATLFIIIAFTPITLLYLLGLSSYAQSLSHNISNSFATGNFYFPLAFIFGGLGLIGLFLLSSGVVFTQRLSRVKYVLAVIFCILGITAVLSITWTQILKSLMSKTWDLELIWLTWLPVFVTLVLMGKGYQVANKKC